MACLADKVKIINKFCSETDGISGKVAVLTFTTSSVEFSEAENTFHRSYPIISFHATASSTRNWRYGFSSFNVGGWKLAEELNRDPISIEVNLRYSGSPIDDWLRNSLTQSYRMSLNLTSGNTNTNWFQMLWDRFGNEIKFSVYLTSTIKGVRLAGNLISSEGMTIKPESYTCSCIVSIPKFLPNFLTLITEPWMMTIKIHVPDSIAIAAKVDVVPAESDYNLEELEALKILDQELYTDVIISAGNGAKIKAHKVYLSVASPVLGATFKNKMKESATGTLDMMDMTEKGVRAFLRYLYGKDLTGPKEDIEVAFDLLQAAHKYHVPKLEALMAAHLEEADEADFTVELVFKIYCFARLWDPISALKKKAIRILKYKWDELVGTQGFQDLFKDGPNSASAKEFLADIVKSQFDIFDKAEMRKKTALASKENHLEENVQAMSKDSGLDQQKKSPIKNEPLDKSIDPADASRLDGKKRDKKKAKVQCSVM